MIVIAVIVRTAAIIKITAQLAYPIEAGSTPPIGSPRKQLC